MSKPSIVAVAGSLHAPSKTVTLATRIAREVASNLDADVHVIQLAQIGRELGAALGRKELSSELEATLARVESADVLVVASPVYRATYTGLFKHLFDFVGQDALVDVPVILSATGGNERHSLVIEHAFRPLFAFFRAASVPTGVYANDKDFENGELVNPEVIRSIERAAWEAVRHARARAENGAGPHAKPQVRAV
jgi:FMN reductase